MDARGHADLEQALAELDRRLAEFRGAHDADSAPTPARVAALAARVQALHDDVAARPPGDPEEADILARLDGLLTRLRALQDGGAAPPVPPAASEEDTSPAEEGTSPAEEGRLVRRTGQALLTQGATAGFTAVLTLVLVRVLGPTDFGLFSLALGITGLLILPADLGISPSVSRFIAERRHDRREVADLLADAFTMKTALVAVLGIVVFALADVVAGWFNAPGLAWPLRGATLALVGQSLMMLFSAAFLSVGRVDRNLVTVTGESAAETVASILLVVLGAGATGAAMGRAIGYLAGALIGGILAARLFGRDAVTLRRHARSGFRRIAGYAGPMFVINSAYTLFNTIDVLLIGAMLNSAAVGLFSAPLRLCAFLHYPGLAVSNTISPRMARSERYGTDVRSFEVALRLLVIVQVAITVPILVWADPIVRLLLGPHYAESAQVLRALTPYILLQGLGPLLTVSVNYLGEAPRRIPITIAAVLINLVIDVVLIPSIGIVAAAIGTDVAYALYVPAHYLICRRILGLDGGALLRTSLRTALAGAVMAIPLLLAGTQHLTIAGWILGAAGALLAYVAVLRITGEVTAGELLAVRRRLTGGAGIAAQ